MLHVFHMKNQLKESVDFFSEEEMRMVTEAGGIVAGRMAILAEGDAQERADIKFLAPLPLFNADGTVKG